MRRPTAASTCLAGIVVAVTALGHGDGLDRCITDQSNVSSRVEHAYFNVQVPPVCGRFSGSPLRAQYLATSP